LSRVIKAAVWEENPHLIDAPPPPPPSREEGEEEGRAISTDLLLHARGELRESFVAIRSITRIDDTHCADDDLLSHEA